MTGRHQVKRSFCVICLAAGLCASSQATTFSIKPVMLNPTCVAGTSIGSTCVQDSDRDTNPGSGDGVCEGIEITFTCTGGPQDGEPCSSSADCDSAPFAGDGICGPDADHQVRHMTSCRGGLNDGAPCTDTSECESAPGERDGICAGDYEITLLPGDLIVTEILGADWSPHGVYPDEACGLWQVDIDLNGFINGECDPEGVFPYRWDRPPDVVPCTTSLDCPARYPICDLWNICVGPNHRPEEGFFIDCQHPEYIFPWPCPIEIIDPWPCCRAGSTDMQPGTEPLYEPPPKYLVTMTLKVSRNACGIFNIRFDMDHTYMMNPRYELLEPSVAESLIIDTGPVPPTTLMTEPANCAIDARQTRGPDVAGAQGWDTFVFHFKSTDDLAGVTAGLFDVRGVPLDPQFPPPPGIDSIDVDNVNKTVTVYLDRPIDPGTNGRWTCIEWEPRGQDFCWGYLPGDVTNDRVTARNDIGALIDHLVDPAASPLELYQCDINRSGACTPADLLRLIDVLAGGDAYAPGWEGGSLISCPSNQPVASGAKRVGGMVKTTEGGRGHVLRE